MPKYSSDANVFHPSASQATDSALDASQELFDGDFDLQGVQDHDTQLPPPGSPTIWTEEAWARGDEGVPLDSDDDIQESQDTELQVQLCIPSQSSY